MGSEKPIIFDPFCLDLVNERLRRGSLAIPLRPKAYAVLNYLLGRPGQLVTKEELLNAVWPETFVGDAVLKVTIRQLREALDDDPKSPRFIETAHRRGYRFVGQIAECGEMLARDQEIGSKKAISASSLRAAFSPLGVVGRDEALSRMQGWLEKMLGGERQIVFVTGEAGIGKTALVDTFARSVASDRGIRIGRGQCLEQYGTSEAYLPVLEELAMHFERGSNYKQAVKYLQQAAENAIRRFAYQEAVGLARRGLELLNFRTLLNAPSKNSGCTSPWACH